MSDPSSIAGYKIQNEVQHSFFNINLAYLAEESLNIIYLKSKDFLKKNLEQSDHLMHKFLKNEKRACLHRVWLLEWPQASLLHFYRKVGREHKPQIFWISNRVHWIFKFLIASNFAFKWTRGACGHSRRKARWSQIGFYRYRNGISSTGIFVKYRIYRYSILKFLIKFQVRPTSIDSKRCFSLYNRTISPTRTWLSESKFYTMVFINENRNFY